MAVMMAKFTGANLIHGTTSEMAGPMVATYEQCVIDDEIMGFVHRLLAGFSLSDEELGLDAAREAMEAPGDGDFLAHPHTLERFRSQTWMPHISCRQATAQWQTEGGSDIHARARARGPGDGRDWPW